MAESKSHAQLILKCLLQSEGRDVPSKMLAAISHQYNARIDLLRRKGFRISHHPGNFRLELSDDERKRASAFISGDHSKFLTTQAKCHRKSIHRPPKDRVLIDSIHSPVLISVDVLSKIQAQITRVNAFYNELRATIYARRKENSEKETGRKWNPEPISKLKQKEILDWIEKELEYHLPETITGGIFVSEATQPNSSL